MQPDDVLSEESEGAFSRQQTITIQNLPFSASSAGVESFCAPWGVKSVVLPTLPDSTRFAGYTNTFTLGLFAAVVQSFPDVNVGIFAANMNTALRSLTKAANDALNACQVRHRDFRVGQRSR